MNPAGVLTAMRLPATALSDQRIPKKLLLENGTPTSADKRLIEAHVAELHWDAVLRPDTVAIPAYDSDVHVYPEVQVMTLTLRNLKGDTAKANRLRELVHRAIPYPLILLDSDGTQTGLSVAPKRRSQAAHDEVVLEHEVVRVVTQSGPYLAPFLTQLALDSRPFNNLRDLYTHWQGAVVALLTAEIMGQYQLPTKPEEALQNLKEHERLSREISSLRNAANREKSLARRADLNQKLQFLNRQKSSIEQQLSSGVSAPVP